jgi:hypothetical protein
MLMVVQPLSRREQILRFFAVFLFQAGTLGATTFTVTNAADSVPPPAGSLRQAILDANANPGPDDIVFAIPGAGPFTINLVAVLPSLTDPVTLDGTTQPGYTGPPQIELNGSGVGASGTGLYLLTSNCVIKGLAINRFAREGIRIETHGGNIIQANFIGTGPFGTNALGNGGGPGYGGITIKSAGNLVGGPAVADRNLISGGNRWGIYLESAAATGNQIQGNFIGVDATGTNRLGNENDGVTLLGAVGNTVGPANVISGNTQSGVYLDVGAASNWVRGNLIGTDARGRKAVSNAVDGVTIKGGFGNWIGGTNPADRNLISGNGGRGVMILAGGAVGNSIQGNYIGTDTNGTARLGNGFGGVEIFNASSNLVGGATPGAGNVISGNSLSGVALTDSNATANVVQGNFLGTDASGTNSLGNARNGVFLSGVTGNLIGGTDAGTGNLISGNLQNGIQIVDYRARSNSIQGNWIGTDVTGARRLGNSLAGIRLEAAANSVGGTTPAAGNVIAGNTNSGILILGATASNNVVQGNRLGTDPGGTVALGNAYAGIGVDAAAGNWIGGTAPGARNVISANGDSGIYVRNGATGNVIQGNYIGTDATGNTALGNLTGGVYFYNCSNNLVGGAAPGAGNLISGNFKVGVAIGDPGANGNVLQGNFIGTRADGLSPLGNEWHGVELLNTASNNIIGGTTPAEFNHIAFATTSAYDGVRVRDGCRRNLVRGNAIFANGGSAANGLGIDLGADGVAINDGCDGDDGGNSLQNYPVLTAAVSGTVTTVRGSLNSQPNATYLLQFYANALAEPSGYGEGQTWVGEATVTTPAGCVTNFTVTLPGLAPVGQRLSATATDLANNTSEFSATVLVLPQPALQMTRSNVPPSVTLVWTNAATGFVLQEATNLSQPVIWTTITNTPVIVAGNFTVTLPAASGSRFYRLLLP